MATQRAARSVCSSDELVCEAESIACTAVYPRDSDIPGQVAQNHVTDLSMLNFHQNQFKFHPLF